MTRRCERVQRLHPRPSPRPGERAMPARAHCLSTIRASIPRSPRRGEGARSVGEGANEKLGIIGEIQTPDGARHESPPSEVGVSGWFLVLVDPEARLAPRLFFAVRCSALAFVCHLTADSKSPASAYAAASTSSSAGVLPCRQLTGSRRRRDGLLAVTVRCVGAGGPDPCPAAVGTSTLFIDPDRLH